LRKTLFAIAGLALFASGAFASLATVNGADHRDGPMNLANPTADINDVYAFRNGNNLVVAISINPLIAPSDNLTRGVFDPAVQLQIHVDRNGDLTDEALINIRGTTDPATIVIDGAGVSIAAPVTPPGSTTPVITDAQGLRVFAGLRDDPFFFDLTAFQAFVANPQAPARGLRPASAGAPADTFAGTNIFAVVIEVPITALTGAANANTGTIKTWVSSTRNGNRIDRMAIPTVNTALIPTAQKDAFNLGSPLSDAATFRPVAQTSIEGLRRAVDALFNGPTTQDGGPLGGLSAAQVAAALIPDVVTINFANPVQFPNGRRLQDDVIDAALGVVLNRGGAAGISDGVNANDKAFLSAFPYLAEPHTAAAAAPSPSPATPSTPIRPPSTGNGGLLDDSGAMWILSAAMFAVAVTLAGAGAFAAMRNRR
jgi:hypothetical protein